MIWDMVKTWIHHSLITAGWGVIGFSVGFIAGGLKGAVLGAAMWSTASAVGFYFGREVRQFEGHAVEAETTLGWIDHIGDTLFPVLVAAGFTMWAVSVWV